MLEADLVTLIDSKTLGATVYPLEIPDGGEQPAIVYQVISRPPNLVHNGVSQTSLARVQFNFMTGGFLSSCQLRDAFENDFNGLRNETAGGTLFLTWQRMNSKQSRSSTAKEAYTWQDYLIIYSAST